MASIASLGEFELDSLGAEQGLVLAEQRSPRLAEDPGEVVAGQVVHLDADREPALELGHQVRRLGAMEGAGGDEQDVVGLDRAVLGVDRRSLDDRQQVALHALARDVRAAARALVAGDLVDLVDEDDARFLGQVDGGLVDLLGIDQRRRSLAGAGSAGPARRSSAGVCDCLGMIFSNMLWRSISICSKLPAPRIETGAIDRPGNRDLDLAVLELAGQQPGLHLLARPLAALGGLVSLGRVGLAASSWAGARARAGRAAAARPAASPVPRRVSRSALRTSTIAASTRSRIRPSTSRPYVADLGVLGGLGLHERRADQHGQPAGDLGLAHAGRADQHDVLGRDLLARDRRRAAGAATGCAGRSPRPAWRRPGPRCRGPARRRSAGGSTRAGAEARQFLHARLTEPKARLENHRS